MADQEQTNPEAPAAGQGQQDPGGSAQPAAAEEAATPKARPAARQAATGATAKKAATGTTAKKSATGTTAQGPAAGTAAERTAPTAAGPARKATAPRAATGKRAAAKRTARGVQKQAESVAGVVTSAVDSVTGSGAPADPLENRLSPKRLSGFDFATWRSAVADPVMRSPIIGLISLDSSPDWDRLVERFEYASRLAPILRQKVVEGPSEILSPRIVVDPEFDLSFHMRRYRVPDPGNWDQVLDEVRRQSMADFDLARPLWRFTVLEGLEGGRAVIILKLHHAIADGQGAMMIGASMIDLSPEYEDLGPLPEAPVSETLDTAGFLGNAVNDASSFLMKSARELAEAALPVATRALKDPVGLVEDLVNVLRSVSRFAALPSRPMSTIMIGRSINYHFETFDIPLDSLKAASKAHGPGLTVNDAFLAGVTGGMRLYHERRNEPVSALRCNMPISLRQADKEAQNAVTIARFEVPVDILDTEARMRAIHAIVEQWRSEPALHLVDPLAEVGFRLLPSDVVTSAAQKSDFTASNVPGVPIPVYIGGARVTRMYPMTGTIGAATNITLLSYNGNAALGVSMDDAAIPDRELFAECLAAGFAEVVGHPVGRGDPLQD